MLLCKINHILDNQLFEKLCPSWKDLADDSHNVQN